MANSLPSPTPGELDVLGAVYELLAGRAENAAARLTEIHEQVGKRRSKFEEQPPKLTTVSTQLRSLVDKGLLADAPLPESGSFVRAPVRTRGIFTPSGRVPASGYRPTYSLGEVLRDSFRGLAETYPENRRYEALIDFAKALDLPEKTLKKLARLLEEL